MNRYDPATHDSILTELNEKLHRTDQEIADEMGFTCDSIVYHRRRLGLPRRMRPRLVSHFEAERRPPKEKANPLGVAKTWLGKRLVEKPSGYWLDGVPVNLDTIMRETNRVLVAAGAEQISHCERWRV